MNDGKTEVCLFYKRDHPLITLHVNNIVVRSKDLINVLGVMFDCKLQLNKQVAQAINKAKRL